MRFAHIVWDEKFIDRARSLFEEVLPDCHDFYLPSRVPARHITETPLIHVGRFAYLDSAFLRKLREYDGIVLHSLTPFAEQVAARLMKHSRIVWIGFGFDYYPLLSKNSDDLLLDETRVLADPGPVHRYKRMIVETGRRLLYPPVDVAKVVQGIAGFAPVLRLEHEAMEQGLGALAPYVDWNYPSIEGVEARLPTGENILLGNSATPTNNHAEALRLLSELDLGERQIICPLSYGEEYYALRVKEFGSDLLGAKFRPLTGYLPYAEYLELIGSCSIVVMNHVRQQAKANIDAMLMRGAKVFMNDDSILLRHYFELGVRVYPLSQLDSRSMERPLARQEVETNQRIIGLENSRATNLMKTQQLIDFVLS